MSIRLAMRKTLIILFFCAPLFGWAQQPKNSVLMKHLKADDMVEMAMLIDGGMDLNAVEFKNGTSLLGQALTQGAWKTSKLLIKEGANVNAKDDSGNTPLLTATLFDRYELAKMMVEKGADVNAVGEHGATAMRSALFNNMQNQGESELPFVQFLLEKGFDLTIVCEECNNTTLIMNAAFWSSPEILAELLKHVDQDFLKRQDADQLNALHYAANAGNLAKVKLLVEAGVPHDTKDKDGATPLEYAKNIGASDVVNYLQSL